MQHAPRPVRLASFVVLAIVSGMLALAGPAHAAVPEPTVHVEAGGDGFLNAQEITDGVMLSGTYDTGAGITSITARVTKEPCLSSTAGTATQSATLHPDGTWEAGPFDLSNTTTFPEGTETCARAFATAGGTNSDVAISDNRPVIDRIAPDAGTASIDDGGDGFIGTLEVDSGVPASWEAALGSDAVSATVWFEDSTATIPADCGPWTLGVTGTGSLNSTCAQNSAEGPITFFATWRDDAGNVSTAATYATVKDTVPPDATITVLDGDGVISQPEVSAGVDVSWEVTETGPDVTIAAANTGDAAPAECTYVRPERGPVTMTLLDAACLDLLADGEITVTVSGEDEAGNQAQASTSSILDRAGPALSIIEVTDPVNLSNRTAVGASGTTDPGSTVEVEVTDGTTTTAPAAATVDVDGLWAVSGIDVSTLADGTITYRATSTNAIGNPTVVEETAFKDTVRPPRGTVVIDDGDGFVNAAETETGVPVSWTAAAGSDAVAARVWFHSGGTIPPGCGPFDVAPTGTISLNPTCAANLAEGSFLFRAVWIDEVGNQSFIRSDSSIKDTIPPAMTISVLDGDGIITAAEASGGVTIEWNVDEAGPDVVVGVANAGAAAPAECTLTDQPRVGSAVFDTVCFDQLAEGPLVATVTGADVAGNSASATDAANLHPTAGNVTFDLPMFANADATKDGFLRVTLELDPDTVITTVSATVTATDEDGNTDTAGPKLLTSSSSQEDRTFLIDVSGLVEGELVVDAELTDSFGQTSAATNTTTLDVTTPVSTWTTQSGAQFFHLSVPFTPLRFSTVSLRGETLEDPGTSNIQFVYLIGTRLDRAGSFGQTAAKSHPNANHVTWQLNTSSLGPGRWRFRVQSQDYAGNLETNGPTIEIEVLGAV